MMHFRKRYLLIFPLILLIGGLVALLGGPIARQINQRPVDGKLSVSESAFPGHDLRNYTTGNFTLSLSTIGEDTPGGYPGPRLYITHRAAPGQWLWYTLHGQAFVGATQSQVQVQEARGSYDFAVRREQTCANQTLDSAAVSGGAITLRGTLDCGGGRSMDYSLKFQAVSDNQLGFDLTVTPDQVLDQGKATVSAYLSYASDADEHFFGFGEQFSYFDLKGKRVPVWISEQGIGRGQQPVTALVDLAAHSGGSAFTSYASVPHYLTSRLRSLFLTSTTYSVFDLRQPDRVQVSALAPTFAGRILYGRDPEALVSEYTRYAGRMRPLPDWILSGAVVGMQGGTQSVRDVYAKLKALGTPLSAFWLQDWVGQRSTSFGKQLWWNWQLDDSRYPGWDQLRADLAQDNVRLLVYASPFLADLAGLKPNLKRNLYAEANTAGYLVKRPDGSPYLIQNTDFSAGLVDLTNPAARAWYEGVLKDEIVGIGASGWMADFGEALPYDAQLANGQTGADFHNAYPVAWAQLNRELIDALPDGDQYVFFTRAAFTRSPAYTTLMWEGDQLTTWDANDGLRSALTGLLSGGLSGFSLNHSDIGGYTGINNPLLHISRSKELLMRWMELSAFTTLYRTHEGNTPAQNAQFYSDEQTLAQFDRFARVYAAWGFLRKRLVQNAAETGLPLDRPLFLNYPDDPKTYNLTSEFLVGPDILVAPVLDPGKNTVRVYLPAGNWLHVWSGKAYRSPYQGQWVTVPAPMGQPGLFVKEGIPDGETFMQNLKDAGLLK